MMTLNEIAAALGGRASADAHIVCVGTDSRRVRPGQLFVALRGEHFDGHDFVAQAAQDGAVATLVDEAWAASSASDVQDVASTLPRVVVADTRVGLGMLAAHWRARFDIPLIGVTGSNGKTTVKEMCAAIMAAQARIDGHGADAVLATVGNLNNDIGLPLTLLELRDTHRAAVIEMGMNHPGEIAYLAAIACPTVAIVTNAQRAHLLGLGSLVEIAREKGTIYQGLVSDGVAIINADDAHADYWRGLNGGRRIVSFGLTQAADVAARYALQGLGSSLRLHTPQGDADIVLAVPGEHNVRNALGAAAACMAAGAGLDAVAAGLAAFNGTRGRLQSVPGLHGATIVDDSYNANPDSVRAAIDVLASTPGRKILVLGDMGEVGRTSAQVHDEIGGYAKSKGVDALFALGEMSAVSTHNFGEGGHHFHNVEALVTALKRQLDGDTVVLVKGSRSMRMERVVDALSAALNPNPSPQGDAHVA